MKANFPEKIYMSPSGVFCHDKKHQSNDVEYTRTDTLIEKACDAYCKVCGHYAHIVPTHICRHDCEYFERFKKEMEL